MDLRQRVKSFINDTGATVTAFCKKIEISPTYYLNSAKNYNEANDFRLNLP